MSTDPPLQPIASSFQFEGFYLLSVMKVMAFCEHPLSTAWLDPHCMLATLCMTAQWQIQRGSHVSIETPFELV